MLYDDSFISQPEKHFKNEPDGFYTLRSFPEDSSSFIVPQINEQYTTKNKRPAKTAISLNNYKSDSSSIGSPSPINATHNQQYISIDGDQTN